MTTVKELIKDKQIDKSQDADGQFEQGCKEQQFATRFVELFFTEYDTIVKNADPEEFSLMIAGVVSALRDLQVRDYMLGIVPNIKNSIDVLESLIEAAPDLADPARALVATVYYESDRIEDAINTINEADADYPLAKLLKRVYSAGWPKESFAQMRSELHPKVIVNIFGEDK